MKQFLIALQFLTVLPLKIKSEIKPKEFGKSLRYFPIVGLMIGLILAALAFFLDFLPNLVKGAFILIASIFITGGIHLDGFTDTCDGFYGGKTKEEILGIMRDSRIGVMGAVGIACLLLLKFTLIVSIPKDTLWESLILMATFSRWAQGLACYRSKYLRENGKAKFFIEYANLKEVIIGGIFTVVLFWLLLASKGLLLFFLSFVLAILCINFIKKKIGGMTGDTIGATSEVAETGLLFFALCFY